ncbi:hypothetical protein [Brevundimonas sp.]|uniref:hypothetical protein n=1 Tax=Brevundimonas sp. TaxID=1871086 RepID=UPI002FC79768
MKLIPFTATAALAVLSLAACTPAEDQTADDASSVSAEASAKMSPADGAAAPADGIAPDSVETASPDDATAPSGQTPPTLPPEADSTTSPATSSPPPM